MTRMGVLGYLMQAGSDLGTRRGPGMAFHIHVRPTDPSVLRVTGARVSACVLADPAGGVGGFSKAPAPCGVWIRLVSGPSSSFR